jgi:hypothetical protein
LLLASASAWAVDIPPVEAAPAAGKQAAPDLVWPQPPQQARIRYLGSVGGPEDIGRKVGFWGKVWNFIRGDEENERIVRPMAVAVDSRDRLLVTDAKSGRVHIFDRRKAIFTPER